MAVVEGYSGSPVFDGTGSVVGIITNQLGLTLALAVPSTEIKAYLPDQPNSLGKIDTALVPAPLKFSDVQTADLRALRIDDFIDVFVNDNAVLEHKPYGSIVPWTSFQSFLRKGENEIRVVVTNGQYGGCGAEFEVRINGRRVQELRRAWARPINQASVGGVCADEIIPLNLD
jgi:hypothetical protein